MLIVLTIEIASVVVFGSIFIQQAPPPPQNPGPKFNNLEAI
jgi:hypothetical protein